MADKVWKQFERVVAMFFHTERNPLSSRFSKHKTMSDTLHRKLYIEAKRDKQFFPKSISSLIDDTELKAKKEEELKNVIIPAYNNSRSELINKY
jgi:hypothetical protein